MEIIKEEKPKNYPVSTPEVAKMFRLLDSQGLLSSNDGIKASSSQDIPLGDLPVANLPVVNLSQNTQKLESDNIEMESITVGKDGQIELDVSAAKKNPLPKIIKTVLPYVLVFTLGIFLYYFFFSKTDITKIFTKQQPKVETAKGSALSDLEAKNLAAYNTWVKSYYFDVSDPNIVDPETDNSGNGLTNFQKYLLKLNPKSYDTLGLGMADSESIAKGINPLSGNSLTESQKNIVSNYIDMEVVMNRLALSAVKANSMVAGVNTSLSTDIRGNSLAQPAASLSATTNSSQNGNTNKPLINNQLNPSQLNNSADNLGINELDINTEIPGRLEIPSLNVNVPIIWTTDPKYFSKDLQNGVVHYPGTALPGQIGTTYISGHSSNYLWAKGNFNQVFSKLGDLADNTSFKITVVQKNGKDARLHYVVTGRQQFKATDQEQFKNAAKPVVALSTCWPINSTAKRLVVFGELTQIEKD